MNLKYENQKNKQGYTHIIGCDEVGRGSLAGPVIAAAVVLDLRCKNYDLRYVKDSKLLSPKKREEISSAIKSTAIAWAVGEVEKEVIDEINIHHASLLAMRRSVENVVQALGLPHGQGTAMHYKSENRNLFLYLDGKFVIPEFDMEQQAIVDGDNKVLSIAAASIVAKVHRDSLMEQLDNVYPKYNFAKHKGYGTLHHRQMILKYGISPVHRLSFCGDLA